MLVILIYALILSIEYGQSGSRYNSKDEQQLEINYGEDGNYWKLGLFYYNPDDSSIWVEKRFGIGLTVNMDR